MHFTIIFKKQILIDFIIPEWPGHSDHPAEKETRIHTDKKKNFPFRRNGEIYNSISEHCSIECKKIEITMPVTLIN